MGGGHVTVEPFHGLAPFFGVRAHRWAHPLTGRPILASDELDAVPAHCSANGAGP